MSEPRPAGRQPGAFRLDNPVVEAVQEPEFEALEADANADRAVGTIAHPRPRGVRFGLVALSTGGGLVALWLTLTLDSLVRALFSWISWLGWLGVVLGSAFFVATAVVIGRELAGLFRLRQFARLRLQGEAAASNNDHEAAVRTLRALITLYRDRPDTARGRRLVAAHSGEIIDGRDLLVLAERDLIAPLDKRAKLLASAAARRVAVVTAVSPRAIFDVIFVLWESVRLIRGMADLYGNRPGAFGLFRLTKAVVSHLAVTGSIAVGDTLLQQIIGHGVAARLSAKLGEGIVNGLLTARIGLSAIDVCRPLPFLAADRPQLKDLTTDLVKLHDGTGR
ncbi:MAG: TIGR01620 family protein [Alphaproteobacteria bacterium]|nr:TIGR01620 family protein [Alphaproteobacteria bacterium]